MLRMYGMYVLPPACQNPSHPDPNSYWERERWRERNTQPPSSTSSTDKILNLGFHRDLVINRNSLVVVTVVLPHEEVPTPSRPFSISLSTLVMNLLVSLSLSEIGRAGDALRRRYGNRRQLSVGFKGLFGRLPVAVIFLLICTVSLFASLKGNNSSLNRPQVGLSYFVPFRVVFLVLSVQFLHLNAMFTLMSEIKDLGFRTRKARKLEFLF